MTITDGRVRPPLTGVPVRLGPSRRRAAVARWAPRRLLRANTFKYNPGDDQHPRRVVEHDQGERGKVGERAARDAARQQRPFTGPGCLLLEACVKGSPYLPLVEKDGIAIGPRFYGLSRPRPTPKRWTDSESVNRHTRVSKRSSSAKKAVRWSSGGMSRLAHRVGNLVQSTC